MKLPDFVIHSGKAVSRAFLDRNILTFSSALTFVEELKYERNRDKHNLLTIFTDNCGTCSTKHALLKLLADENNYADLQLVLGIFKMSPANTPLVKVTLDKSGLEYIPEAHNYLRYKGAIVDCTKPDWKISAFPEALIEETEILPGQITDYKVNYHRLFLERWLEEHKHVPYSLDELWSIKEQCIRDLSE